MIVKYCTILLAIVFAATGISCNNAQHNAQNNPGNNFEPPTAKKQGLLILNSRACYFDDVDSIEKKLEIKIDTPSRRETEQINSIMSYTGLPQNFKIYRGDINNAMATMVNDQRLIIYNKDLFARIDDIDSSYWSSMFILAHEIGHHLAYNISDTSSMLNAELEADIFAGAILYKMGADSNQVIAAVASRFISNTKDTKTHPAKYKRIAAIKKSWYQSSQLRYLSAIPPPIRDHFSLAAGKPTLSDGYGATTTGYNFMALIHNGWVMDTDKSRAYGKIRYADSLHNISILESGSRNYQGIIVDVQQKPAVAGYSEHIFFEIEVIITKIDTACNKAGLAVNQKHRFLVCLDTFNSFIGKMGPFEFFAGGRRFGFDLYDMQNKKETGGLLNLSRADAL